jgi:hypothetical protein
MWHVLWSSRCYKDKLNNMEKKVFAMHVSPPRKVEVQMVHYQTGPIAHCMVMARICLLVPK